MTKETVESDVNFGLSGINLEGKVIDMGQGIQLRPTFAHLFSTDVLAFAQPASPLSFHPGPWQAVSRRPGVDITAELFIPKEYGHKRVKRIEVGHTIISLLRLWYDPRVTTQVLTKGPIAPMRDRKDKGGEFIGMIHGGRERFVEIAPVAGDNDLTKIDWVAENWSAAVDLRGESTEFDFALDTFDNAQCIPNTAMMLVSIWGALEAIFSPHKAELVFRVSAQLAAFLEGRGATRMAMQREIVKLYNLRSAAAHGSPKHGSSDLIATFHLLRMAIIRMVERKSVPDKEALEKLLFEA
ncbi:HEPN domain-containing protein [Pandoraea terrigena]|uniref:Uncharacterized protein n=1 Tax=Pandoraea terrigena TaxID=2508292 RepID=A0A5E4YBH9_9BURK|nr:HEPN domain-containing protein [Pandoraea terrigena]VVE46076.1 hypothetical protein PTE31013_04440 [Pandoraea terrigena]